VGVVLVCGAIGAGMAATGSAAAGWTPSVATAMPGAAVGAGAMTLAGLLGAAIIGAAGRDPRRAANAAMAASGVRLIGGMALGLAGATLLSVAERPLWAGVLCAGGLSLACETFILTRGARGTARAASPAGVDAR
jgi:hypothetical protein